MFSSSFGLNGIFRLVPNKFATITKKYAMKGGYIDAHFTKNSIVIAVLEQEKIEWWFRKIPPLSTIHYSDVKIILKVAPY